MSDISYFEGLRQTNLQVLRHALEAIPAPMQLVVDPAISCLFHHILSDNQALLQDHGIVGLHELSKEEEGQIKLDPSLTLVFLIQANIDACMKLVDYIERKGPVIKNRQSHVLYLPRMNRICEQVFTKANATTCLQFHDLPFGFMPVDRDILTLGDKSCMAQAYLHGNKTSLANAAHALVDLERHAGEFLQIKFKGSMSKLVWKHMMQLKDEQPASPTNANNSFSGIDTLIILDRKVDLASILCTPLTYEALLDELIGMDNGFITVDSKVLQDQSEEPTKTPADTKESTISLALNSSDEVYADLRDRHLEGMHQYLLREAQEIRERYNSFREKTHTASISEVHGFVQLVPELKHKFQSLSKHINLAELLERTTKRRDFRLLWQLERSIIHGNDCCEEIERLIFQKKPLPKVLRLLSLQCIVMDGLPPLIFENLRNHIVQTYGFEVIFSLNNLMKAGLIGKRGKMSKTGFAAVKSNLQLIQNNVAVTDPTDIAYVSSGYAPLTMRLVECIVEKGSWQERSQQLKQLIGPTAELSQMKTMAYKPKKKKVIMVCIVGGATYMEVAAMRQLSKRDDCEILICTTAIMSGTAFIETFVERIENGRRGVTS